MKKEQKPQAQASAIKNVYVLSFTSGNIIKFNQLFIELLAFEEFEASLINQMIIEGENKALYWVKISLTSLFEFKKELKKIAHYKSFELFEYKEW